MHIFAIGDVHGHLELMTRAIAKIEDNASDGDMIVMLGDYIDRGPDSAGVVKFLRGYQNTGKLKMVCLKGNHEDLMIEAFDHGETYNWLRNGGHETLNSYLPVPPLDMQFQAVHITGDLEWMRNLPVHHETKNFIFVHAGLRPGVKLHDQDPTEMMWIRDKFLNANKEDFPDGKVIVHGHTPDRDIENFRHRVNLDTAAFYYGTLSVGMFNADDQFDRKFFTIKEELGSLEP